MQNHFLNDLSATPGVSFPGENLSFVYHFVGLCLLQYILFHAFSNSERNTTKKCNWRTAELLLYRAILT